MLFLLSGAFPDPAASPLAPGASPLAPALPAYGLLWLQIDPDDVEIALDGQYLDKDVWLVSVAPGNHVVSVSKPGFKPQESRFGIAPRQNVRLDITLSPADAP
ncbi:MAG: hypothetical protein JWP91_1987 [Fibrobacteres bacterium]|nr:hypothetical protein [Fibrobacterota bacterium]